MHKPGRRVSKGRSAVSIFFWTISLFSLAYPPSPRAAARDGCFWYLVTRYYTTANFSAQCGYHTYWCDGTDTQEGCVTEYTRVLTCTCRE